MEPNPPKIFISYSWSPIQNKEWVHKFALRLSEDGVYVVMDEWDIKEGQDKYHFMEQMVNDDEIKFVLLICNKDYAKKANLKKGGVGIESQIISDEIYSQVDQSKFIPIVREYDSEKPTLPTFVKSRFYIDLADSTNFENGYEKLLRRIFNRPKYNRPPIGKPPSYLNDKEPVYLNTSLKLTPAKNAIVENKANKKGFITDFFDGFYEILDLFHIPEDANRIDPPIDEIIIEKYESLRFLKDQYLEFIQTYIKYSNVDKELLKVFLEKCYNKINYDISDSYYDHNDHLQLFLNEIYLNTVGVLLKSENFEACSYIINSNYAIEKKYDLIKYEGVGWIFNKNYKFINEIRRKRLQIRETKISSGLIKQRTTSNILSFKEIAEADLLIHYCTVINYSSTKEIWWPKLSIYLRRTDELYLIQKMQSRNFFEKAKTLFMVNSKEELFNKIENINLDIYKGYYDYRHRFRHINSAFRKEKISCVN